GPVVHILPLSVTYRDIANPGQVYADVYRTLADGSTFYFLSRISVSNLPTATEVLYPNPAFASTDNQTDANLRTASLLYVTGDVLDNVNPPATAFSTTHRGRKAI